jgi:uncharacterized protein
MRTVLLLLASNVFMTFAWYGHLKHKAAPLLLVIGVSWLIALPEYALQVPANRWGHGTFTASELKVMQEVISLLVFSLFAIFWLKEPLRWNVIVSFGLIVLAVWVAFAFRQPATP